MFDPTFGNPPPEHPLMYPTEIRSNANVPIGTNRRVLRFPNFAALASAVISVSNSANVNIHIGRAELFGVDGGTVICANPRAVVVTVIVVGLPAVTDDGLNDALAPVGNPLAVNVTVPGKAPPTVAVAIVKFAELPAVTVCEVVVALTLKSVIVNVNEFDVPPPGVGFTTVIAAVPELCDIRRGNRRRQRSCAHECCCSRASLPLRRRSADEISSSQSQRKCRSTRAS